MKELHQITGVFSDIIDSKSKYTSLHSRELSKKAAVVADYYNFISKLFYDILFIV